ncbi:restriction endonuclease EcoKI subunit S [Kosakonia radicincitans UMEnt01/12]|uniref:restriction endonuclease subunit S n=1 Tax=Kosakonia radicincitans TaxID=283686 RepID=UPI0004615D05|nr:restriction endonuclease subunit S [Kosakonia radicincitans]KDE37037.1 restriction endonuclease EcoKI subunit S [Kosakonia radicincitans UMEnt01/12]
MSAGKLPEGWSQIVLGDVVEVNSGVGFPEKYQGKNAGDYPVYKVRDISVAVLEKKGFLNSAGHYVTENEAFELKGKIFRSGSTLFAKIGEAVKLNRRAYVRTAGLADNNVMAVSSILEDMDKFIYYILNTVDLTETSRSTTVPSIRKGDIENITLSLPPLAEQKIIAEKLDTLLAQVDSTKARLEQIPKILKRFRQAVLAAATNGNLTSDWRDKNNNITSFISENNTLNHFRNTKLPILPYKWKWLHFDQVAEIASNLKSPANYPTEIHIAPNHIESWTGKISGYQTIAEDGVTSAKHQFHKGQIIYSKIRPYLCKVTIATFDGLCSADMYPINSKIDTYFLFRWMLTTTFTDWASNAESRTVLPKINQKDLSEIPVPTPPIEEQHEIVRRVEQLFAYADTIEKQVNAALARVNNLTQSILAKAFRGELTAQWRAENPDLIFGENSAAALLEKIKAERAASGGKKASRKKA